jgi:hypothetical protein
MNIIGDYEAHRRDEEFDRNEDARLARKKRAIVDNKYEALAVAVREECSAAGCEGPFDDVCTEFDAPQDQWCPWCRLGHLLRKCEVGLDTL